MMININIKAVTNLNVLYLNLTEYYQTDYILLYFIVSNKHGNAIKRFGIIKQVIPKKIVQVLVFKNEIVKLSRIILP